MQDTNHAEQETHNTQDEQQAAAEQQQAANGADQAAEETFKEQLVRVSADFSNYKRRMEKERTQWIHAGHVAVIQSFLPLVDDVERAIQATRSAHAEQDSDVLAQALEGLELVEKNMQKVLQDVGIAPVDCDGAFDPHYHEALMQADSSDHESGQIVQVLSKGYVYKDTVIRHAKVSVAK